MTRERTLRRASAYIQSCPESIQGENGSAALFRVCCALTHGFGLDEADAVEILLEFNDRCIPPWSDDELDHALRRSIAVADHQKPFCHLLHGRRRRSR